MRRRLVLATLAVAVVAVLLLGVPLAVAGSVVVRDQAVSALSALAEDVAREVTHDIAGAQPIDLSGLRAIRPTDSIRVVHVGQEIVRIGEPPAGKRLTAVNTSTDTTVTIMRSAAFVERDQVRVGLLVLTLGFIAVVASVGVGIAQARRLSEPLIDLGATAKRLGSGESRQTFPRYGLVEVDRVAEALEASAERIHAMLARERQFASDASHQLRTPLTALSMRLEEILHADDPEAVREEARVALTQVERLSAVVDHLLSSARQSRTAAAVAVPIDNVVLQQVEEWRPAYDAARRAISLQGSRGLTAVATPGGMAQVLATLLENSLVHGAGTVTVRTRTTGVSVVIEVTDEGPGVPTGLGAVIFERSVSGRSSTGLGLALARDIAEADGGRLELLAQRPPVFALFLSAPDAMGARG